MIDLFQRNMAVLAMLGGLALPAAEANADTTVRPMTVENGDVRIVGEIHQARPDRPATVVIVTGGSTARTRAETGVAVPLFLSETRAVAIHDRRGNGESSGTFERPSTENTDWQIPLLATDIEAIAAHLKGDGFATVGVAGSSMGSWVAIAAAARSDDIDFVVCIAGTANSVGVSDNFDDLTDDGLSIDAAVERARRYAGVQGYEPAAHLLKMTQPGLWVLGAADDSNPTQLDVEVLEVLKTAGKPFEVMVLPDTDHEFMNVKTGEPNFGWVPEMLTFVDDAAAE